MIFKRPYGRYKQIFEILMKYGFEDVAESLSLKKTSMIRKYFEKSEYIELAKLPPQIRVRMILEELGPTFIKFGQILSTRPDLIPADYALELGKLQDCVPKISYEKVKDVIEQELGKKIDTMFPYFEKEPIASASIGQVHIAKLKNGKKVVVKIQKPNIERTIENDIRLLDDLAGLLESYMPESKQIQPRLIVSEFAKTIRKEQNYRREARNAMRLRQNFSGSDTLYIPEVYWEFITKRVLVLEYMDGIRFNDYLKSKQTPASKKVLAKRINDAYMKMILEDGFFHADPHPGNIIIQKNNVIGLVDFGIIGYIDHEFRKQLVNLLYALGKGDTEKTITVFLEIGMLSDDTDLKNFRSDFYAVLHEYYNTELKEVRIAEMFIDILDVARVHKVRLPHNFIYLIKVIGEIESISRKLDPEFNLTRHMGPYLKKLIDEQIDPKYLVKNIEEGIIAFNDFVWKMPRRINNVFDKLEHGKLKIEFEHKGLEKTNHQIEKASDNVSFAVIIAAIIIGSSLLIQKGGLLLTLIGVVGYLFAAILGFALVILILNSRRG